MTPDNQAPADYCSVKKMIPRCYWLVENESGGPLWVFSSRSAAIREMKKINAAHRAKATKAGP